MKVLSGLIILVVLGGVAFGQAAADGHGTVGATAEKRPMTFGDLQRLRRVSDPQISPSGKWVMFSVVDVDLAANTRTSHLWVVPMGGGGEEAVGGSKASGSGASLGGERQITFWKEGESGGRFSPDGRHVAFVATASGQSQIFLADWDEGAGKVGTPRQLTRVSTEADGPVWSPDSQRILFVSRVYPECSGEDSWLHEDECNKKKDEAAANSPVKAMIFDKLLYRHWNGYVGPKRSHVLVVAAADGNAMRDLTPSRDVADAEVPTFSLGGPIGYAWAPDSKEVAYVTNLDLVPAASTNNDVFTLRLDEPRARPVRISTSLGSDDGPAYSQDGKWIAFRSQERAGYESDRFRLMLFDREKKTPGEYIPHDDGWIDEFVWAPDSKYIFSTSGYHGAEVVGRFTLNPRHATATQKGEHSVIRLSGQGEFSSLAATPDSRQVIAVGMKVDRPAELFSFQSAQNCESKYGDVDGLYVTEPELDNQCGNGEPAYRLTQLNDKIIDGLAMSKMDSFWFSGAGETKVQGFIVRPPNFNPAMRYPVKFLIHGGPQGAWGDAWSYRWNPQLMAADGYVVVMVNPRGSTGYGQAFIDGVNGDWGGKAYVDLMNGLDAAEAKYPFIDKNRECALGASYGGYMANWILTHTNRFACIVTHDGMFNPQSAYGSTEELWFNEWEFKAPAAAGPRGKVAAVSGPGQPWEYFDRPVEGDPFRKWSPMLSIRNARTPTLVIHSQRDYRLDVSEGFQLFTALQRLGVPSRMLYFPDEGHWVLKPQNSQLWYQEVGDWCDRWTKASEYGAGRVEARVPVVAPAAPAARAKVVAPAAAVPKVMVPVVTQGPAKVQAAPAPAAVAEASIAAPAVAKASATAQAPQAGASFVITINAPEDEVQVGSDARVVITLKNISDHQVLVGRHTGVDSPEFTYRIEVRNAEGRTVEETAYARGVRPERDSSMVDYVQPGGVAVQTAHVAKLVNLRRPGRYTVQVLRRDPKSNVVVRSNEITLSIVP
jgi:dipeptidyl aminopeptidase/acylaminoacyl peptidase